MVLSACSTTTILTGAVATGSGTKTGVGAPSRGPPSQDLKYQEASQWRHSFCQSTSPTAAPPDNDVAATTASEGEQALCLLHHR